MQTSSKKIVRDSKRDIIHKTGKQGSKGKTATEEKYFV
jgi:hypothetical protein